MRPHNYGDKQDLAQFQSTHPLRDATLGYIWGVASIKFQSTHPLRDATLLESGDVQEVKFQSTHPLRDATGVTLEAVNHLNISIHAPLTGCDLNNR